MSCKTTALHIIIIVELHNENSCRLRRLENASVRLLNIYFTFWGYFVSNAEAGFMQFALPRSEIYAICTPTK